MITTALGWRVRIGRWLFNYAHGYSQTARLHVRLWIRSPLEKHIALLLRRLVLLGQ